MRDTLDIGAGKPYAASATGSDSLLISLAMEDIVIHPHRGKREKTVPSLGLLCVNPVDAKYAHQRLGEDGGRRRHLYNSRLTVAADASRFVAGPAVGAPMAAMTMEKLIVLGAKQIVLFGWCGAVSEDIVIGDLLLGGCAVAGEGTSRYYGCENHHMPCPDLTRQLAAALEDASPQVRQATIWSTDAPYREDRRMLAELQKEHGIEAIDMEYGALCAVSRFRNCAFAALLLVSDELHGPAWRPGFTARAFQKKRETIMDLLLTISLEGGR